MLELAVFALCDLKQGREVLLGWEWDNGNTVHPLCINAVSTSIWVSPLSPKKNTDMH